MEEEGREGEGSGGRLKEGRVGEGEERKGKTVVGGGGRYKGVEGGRRMRKIEKRISLSLSLSLSLVLCRLLPFLLLLLLPTFNCAFMAMRLQLLNLLD